jgi:hypothetical protein
MNDLLLYKVFVKLKLVHDLFVEKKIYIYERGVKKLFWSLQTNANLFELYFDLERQRVKKNSKKDAPYAVVKVFNKEIP